MVEIAGAKAKNFSGREAPGLQDRDAIFEPEAGGSR